MIHHYGPQVNFIDKPQLRTVLTKLCSPEVVQPLINTYVHYLYTHLLEEVINQEFAQKSVSIPTRMTQAHPDKLLTSDVIDPNQKAVCINLARAGTFPTHVCYEQLHLCLNQELIRQDHIFAARMTNDQHQVTSTHLDGFKIGGDVDNAIVLIPDPMGATGTTVISTVEHYKKKIPGQAKKYIALHLIITPEY
ncbi:MAG: uracil phosphoribosyltransferase, partial [Bdellovibrionales bacterium]|nr:uracil phosphoribosyltransferase [Bdellovibrionales bacterium]